MPKTATLRTWHDDRGFGFIAPTDGGPEVFVHISAFPPEWFINHCPGTRMDGNNDGVPCEQQWCTGSSSR